MQIYYFTRSTRSQKIAEELALKNNTTARRIDDHKNWQGKWGYIKAAVMAISGKTVKIDYQKPEAECKIVVVCPLWAGKLPPAVKAFAKEIGAARLVCVVTSLGSKLTERDGFAQVIDLVGEDISAPDIAD